MLAFSAAKFTLTWLTPGNFERAFSILAAQEAQVIPFIFMPALLTVPDITSPPSRFILVLGLDFEKILYPMGVYSCFNYIPFIFFVNN
jgi:hypothetical protein